MTERREAPWAALRRRVDERLLSAVEAEHGEHVVWAVEHLARDVGAVLVARGLGPIWWELFLQLASTEHGHSIGDVDPDAGPVPAGAELDVLAQRRA